MKGTAYLLQATLISLWWLGLLLSESFCDAFQFPGIGSKAFNAFMIPDLIIVAGLSLVRTYKERRELDFIILGGFAFATLYCVNASLLTRGGLLSTTVMVLGLCYNLFLISEKHLFREATTSNLAVNAIKTLFQIICVWIITLVIFPTLIIKSFDITSHVSDVVIVISITLFVCCSMIGLYSAYTMVKHGEGTPLPLDQTKKLVITGPYQYVRNPMAIAGIGQGLAVSIYFWSFHIFIYTLLGAVLWQFVVRPIEEKDMINRFGNEYLQYMERTKCWIPSRQS